MTQAPGRTGPFRPSPALPHLEETVLAVQRYLQTVSGLTDAELRAPSVLPGWTRGHVVAHVARNAEALTRLLHWARTGEPTPMYVSDDERAAGIDAGAALSAAELLADSAEAAAQWEAAARGLPEDRLEAPVSRLLDSPPFPVRRVGVLRRTEVEVHHADLDAGYTAHDWPADLLDHLLRRRERELTERAGFLVVLEDRDQDRPMGRPSTDPVVVSGRTPDVVWWLLGRGAGEGLRCSAGQLPELGRWA